MRTLWTYPYPLDGGTLAELRLPPDLTRAEADRLKHMLDALVIEPDQSDEAPPVASGYLDFRADSEEPDHG